MKSPSWIVLLIAAFIVTVRCQLPQIVEDIFPEVKKKSDTGYLNCTVSRQQNNKVVWIQPNGGVKDAWISMDTEVIAGNRETNGKLKYEVIRKHRGNDKTTYTLVVNHLLEEDSGRYICTIYIQGKEQSQWPSKYGNMTVQVPPTIVVSQTSNTMETYQGADVSLRCNATGTPTPNITWIRADGMPLPDGSLNHMGHVYNITALRKDDRGVYRCLADNAVIPPASHDAKLVVYFKPEASAVQYTVGQAQNRRFHAILECSVKGFPDPSLRWYQKTDRGLMTLTDNEKFDINQLLTHGTSLQLNAVWYSLKILNVQANDYTTYYCEGKNRMGSARAEIQLYETNECQGPACPSIGAPSRTAAPNQRESGVNIGAAVGGGVAAVVAVVLLVVLTIALFRKYSTGILESRWWFSTNMTDSKAEFTKIYRYTRTTRTPQTPSHTQYLA